MQALLRLLVCCWTLWLTPLLASPDDIYEPDECDVSDFSHRYPALVETLYLDIVSYPDGSLPEHKLPDHPWPGYTSGNHSGIDWTASFQAERAAEILWYRFDYLLAQYPELCVLSRDESSNLVIAIWRNSHLLRHYLLRKRLTANFIARSVLKGKKHRHFLANLVFHLKDYQHTAMKLEIEEDNIQLLYAFAECMEPTINNPPTGLVYYQGFSHLLKLMEQHPPGELKVIGQTLCELNQSQQWQYLEWFSQSFEQANQFVQRIGQQR